MNSCAPFVRKTFQLVSDNTTNHIVSWCNNGANFTIWNTQAFQKQILPQYFKHNNLCSFVRQLNTYGFHKINATDAVDGLEFSHPSFKQGAKHLLAKIKRRKSKAKKSDAQSSPVVQDANQLKVAEALISLVKRQQESEQLLMSVCAELQEARSVINSLQSGDKMASPSLCGKRAYEEVEVGPSYPVAKKLKSEENLFSVPTQEMFSFDELFQPTQSTCAATMREHDAPIDFDIKELLLDF
uniref:HSF-type DNA-binding domain-containing protein n=1 Tax=Vannella robusta TaxID=1487602 RepID=A0A7S4MDA5_9EUKA|mmetsp:Transcript_18727/g.23741  ORF Transcript_18727/g.23741 Transcript_18727/m.23741 type:complete len:241 (+) Transcript_18727:146-868(+)